MEPRHTPGEETCSRCGAVFGCTAAQPGVACWCAELHVTSARLAELAHRYSGCLCPTCLRQLAASAEPISGDYPAAPDSIDSAG